MTDCKSQNTKNVVKYFMVKVGDENERRISYTFIILVDSKIYKIIREQSMSLGIFTPNLSCLNDYILKAEAM